MFELYRDQPGLLTAVELAGALLCADVAFWALLGSRVGADPEGAEPQPLTDLDRLRAEIHRATGMVMIQLGISAESAMATPARIRLFPRPAARRRRPSGPRPSAAFP